MNALQAEIFIFKSFYVKKLRLRNVSIHRIFYQNRFINKYARNKKGKKPRSPRVETSDGVFIYNSLLPINLYSLQL